MRSTAQTDSVAAPELRQVSLREQQLSRRLGIRLWSRVGDTLFFESPEHATTDPDSILTLASTARGRQDSVVELTPADSAAKAADSTQSAAITDGPHATPLAEINDWSQTKASTDGTKASAVTKISNTDTAQGRHESLRSDSAAPDLTHELTSVVQGSDSAASIQAQPSVRSPTADQKSGHFVDPNDAFADAALMDGDDFNDYSSADSARQAITELMGKLSNSPKAHEAQSSRLTVDEAVYDSGISHDQTESKSVNQRVEWLSFAYGAHLVVAEASGISHEEKELLERIAQACHAQLLPISFPLNQNTLLPAYFSDQQAFGAFISGRLARQGVKELIGLGKLNSPWHFSFKAHEALSLQACLANPMLKADLWRVLNQV